MKSKSFILLIICLLLATATCWAWDFWPLPMAQPDTCKDTINYTVSLSAVAGYGSNAPFLLYANTNAEVSTAPFSGNLSAGIWKMPTRPSRWFDYDFAAILTGRLSSDKQHTGYFSQLYAHVRLYVIDITAGIKPVSYGSSNPSLSSGCLIISQNAHPVPRITIGIDNYTAFPGLYGYLAVKGGITHAWLSDNNPYVKQAMLHHKFIGFQVGGKLPVNLTYEFHHVAQWGGYSAQHGDLGNDFNSFIDAFFVRAGGKLKTDQDNAHGNHIGVQELALHLNYRSVNASIYWQAIFEDKSAAFIGAGTNRADGLWGLTLAQNKWPFINAFTFEFLNTTSQSGPVHDQDGLIYAGRDSYYSNSVYPQGWTYFSRVIGNPFIQPDNSRVRMCYAALAGDIYRFQYRAAAAYTHNFGTYFYPKQTTNTSILLEVSRQIPKAWNLQFALSLAADFSKQNDDFAAMVTIRKNGIIWNY